MKTKAAPRCRDRNCETRGRNVPVETGPARTPFNGLRREASAFFHQLFAIRGRGRLHFSANKRGRARPAGPHNSLETRIDPSASFHPRFSVRETISTGRIVRTVMSDWTNSAGIARIRGMAHSTANRSFSGQNSITSPVALRGIFHATFQQLRIRLKLCFIQNGVTNSPYHAAAAAAMECDGLKGTSDAKKYLTR